MESQQFYGAGGAVNLQWVTGQTLKELSKVLNSFGGMGCVLSVVLIKFGLGCKLIEWEPQMSGSVLSQAAFVGKCCFSEFQEPQALCLEMTRIKPWVFLVENAQSTMGI